MILVIDNYDSFTYNLVQYLGELGATLRVRRNDQVTLDEIAAMAPGQIVISPGPGRPEDAGVSVDVIRRFGPTTPILGVCLGHPAEFPGALMFTGLLEKVVRHEDLTEDEAAAAMREVMEGRANAAALGALLTGLVMKGERPSEIVGFARTMREHAVKLSAPVNDVFDTCGTGGDRSGTFNISTA